MSSPVIPATTTAPAKGAGAGEAAKSENPSTELGKNDFLKLMVAQLQAQNPLEPTSDTQYVGELAQFSQLEQTSNLASSSGEISTSQKVAQAVALIGHSVSYLEGAGAGGATAQGKVQSVEITPSGPTLTVEGIGGIDPASVSEVS